MASETTDAELRRLLSEDGLGDWSVTDTYGDGYFQVLRRGPSSSKPDLPLGDESLAALIVALRNTAASLLDRLAVAEKRAAEAYKWAGDQVQELADKVSANELIDLDIEDHAEAIRAFERLAKLLAAGPTPPTELKETER